MHLETSTEGILVVIQFEFDIRVYFLLFEPVQKGGDNSVVALGKLLGNEVATGIWIFFTLCVAFDALKGIPFEFDGKV